MKELAGKVVVVTGAASGIGCALAERFYVLAHPEFRTRVRERLEDILEDRVPVATLTLG